MERLIIGTILVLLTSIAAITNTVIAAAEDKIDCDANSDHPFCNGKRGQNGLIFCSLKIEQQMSCWDDKDGFVEDDPLIFCVQDPETKDECKLTEDEKGMMN